MLCPQAEFSASEKGKRFVVTSPHFGMRLSNSQPDVCGLVVQFLIAVWDPLVRFSAAAYEVFPVSFRSVFLCFFMKESQIIQGIPQNIHEYWVS